MKKILHILLIFFSISTHGQPPQLINYQGVARDATGHPIINQNVSIRLSILDGAVNGSSVYSETHNLTTNNSGLFNLAIGGGSVISGIFDSIPWAQGSKWLKIEMDTSSGGNYLLIGTTQFLSVPFALHAQTANSLDKFSSTLTSFSFFSQRSPNKLTYFKAIDYCYSLSEGGYTDWKMPTMEEFQNYIEINGLSALPSYFYNIEILWTKVQTYCTNSPYILGLYYDSSTSSVNIAPSGATDEHYIFCI